jgi:hypothetical protein
MEETTLEEIPEDVISTTEKSVQSSSRWRQAQSSVNPKTDSKIPSS